MRAYRVSGRICQPNSPVTGISAFKRKTLSAEEIFRQAAQGDIVAESAVQIFEDRLARGLAMVINLCDPDIILLSGRMSQYDRLLVNIPRKWPGYIAGRIPNTRLIAPFPIRRRNTKSISVWRGYAGRIKFTSIPAG